MLMDCVAWIDDGLVVAQMVFNDDKTKRRVSSSLKLPPCDLAFPLTFMNPELRKEFNADHPMPVDLPGVYLVYADGCDGVIPLYVGRSKTLRTRLWQHQQGGRYSTWRQKFDDELEFALFDETWPVCPRCHNVLLAGKCVEGISLECAAWVIQDERERFIVEHDFIQMLNPLFNSA